MKSKAPGQRSWLQVRLEVCWSALRLRRPGGFGSLGLAEAERPYLSARGDARPLEPDFRAELWVREVLQLSSQSC
jgi:hypothetical protein